jgi:integrating conjugative element protein (TIGR03757 family)
LAAALLACICADATARDVLAITDQRHPVTAPTDVRVILLDAPTRLKSQLSADLPADPERAALIAKQRLAEGRGELQRRFRRAYQDVTEAWQLGVTKVPAVVVDRRYVIYGETNVEAAIARIQAYRSSHP